MKKIDLNITLPEGVNKGEQNISGIELAKNWIGSALQRAINKPDAKTNRPTVNVGMEVQRKYFRVMDTLDKAVDGIAEIEDGDYDFLKRKFSQAQFPVQGGVNEILVAIEERINKAE